MYTLYGYPKTRSVRVAWALEELQLSYNYVVVDVKKGAHFSDEYRQLHPSAKIPLLKTKEGVLAESGAIVTYLADKHAPGAFAPEVGTIARGKYQEILLFLLCELEQPLWSLAKHKFALPEALRLEGMLNTASAEWERAYGVFCLLLNDNNYLLGDSFSMVDILAGQILAWAQSSGMALDESTTLSYMERVLSRPAHEKAWRKEKSQATQS